jgi:hypothetical protein
VNIFHISSLQQVEVKRLKKQHRWLGDLNTMEGI